MKWLSKIFNKQSLEDRKVTKSKFLFRYLIFSGIAFVAYSVTALVLDLIWYPALTPFALLLLFVVYRFLVANWTLMRIYIGDMEQGKLLMYLNDATHFTMEHKLRVVKWVYLKRKTIRREEHAEISNEIMEGYEVTPDVRKRLKYKQVFCPQQLRDGFNEALLVHVLIHAHNNILVLDPKLRDIMNLTDENMLAFDITKEYDKCKDDNYKKKLKIGQKAAEKLN